MKHPMNILKSLKVSLKKVFGTVRI